MKNIFLFVFCGFILLFLFVGGGLFFFGEKNARKQVEMQLEKEKMDLAEWRKKFKDATKEQEELKQEAESLRANALRYLDINNRLQEENVKFQSSAGEDERLKRIIEEKNQKIEKLENIFKIQKLAEKTEDDDRQEQERLAEITEANEKLKSLENVLIQERGLYHYNLGVAYTRAQLYTEALAAYQKSLEFQPDNYEAHYNLGLLYGEVKRDSKSATFHYRKYLELNPTAEDFAEVQELINHYTNTFTSREVSRF